MSQTKSLRSNVIQALGKNNLVSKRLLEAISRNPSTAFWYAQKVLHHRWPEGEEAIAKDAGPALAYARDVLHRPWPEGEEAIFKDYNYTYYYGQHVCKIPTEDLYPWVLARCPDKN